jgi:branched-chain amino acid transport system permease protein
MNDSATAGDTASAIPRARRPRLAAWRALAPWVISLVVMLVIPLFVHSNGTFTILNAVAINIVFALSYNMLLGQAGVLSFGHAVFYGFGGFAAIHVMNAIGDASMAGGGFWAHFPVFALPLVGLVAGGLSAFIIGWPFCKHRGVAFAMITLGLGELIASGSQMFPSVFGGEAGIFSDRTVGPSLFGFELVHASDVYWFMVFWVFVATLAMWGFSRTPLGRMSNALRDNPDRLQFIGYPPRNLRFLVFIAAGAFGGLAGSMAVVNSEIITTGSLGLITSGLVLLMAAVGGLGVFYGPIVGAILVTFMNTSLSDFTNTSVLYVGIVFLAIVMFASSGVGGGIEQARQAWRKGEFTRHLPGWSAGVLGTVLIALGLITLVEAIYGLRHGPDKLARIVGIDFNPDAPWSWIVVIVLFIAGYGLFRITRKYREIEE